MQVDPIGMASVNPLNPQSLNLYAYTANDPVNYVDPLGLECKFYININNNGNLTDNQLEGMRNEISRIFSQAGHTALFNQPELANGGSYTINIGTTAPSTISDGALGSTPVIDGRVASYGSAYKNRMDRARDTGESNFRTLAQHPTNYGRGFGRVAAHEAGHYFLGMSRNHSDSGLMRETFPRSPRLFLESGEADYNFTQSQANMLQAKCMGDLKKSDVAQSPGRGGGGRGGEGWIRPRDSNSGNGWTSLQILDLMYRGGGGGGSVTSSYYLYHTSVKVL